MSSCCAGPDPWSPSNEGLTEKGFGSPPIPLPHDRFLLTLGPVTGQGPLGRLRFYHQLVPSLLTGASLLRGPAPFPFPSKESVEQVASESYLAESYLVLTVGSLGGNCLRMGSFPFPAPHSLQEMSLSLGEPLSSVGKLQGGCFHLPRSIRPELPVPLQSAGAFLQLFPF